MPLPYNFFQQVDQKMDYIVLGDTDSMFINIPSLKPKTTEEAIELSKKLGKEINAAISHVVNNEILPKMGIDPKYNCTQFKTEIVANGLLLMGVKKKYAYRMLAKEGKKMDPPMVSYTGLGVKSDEPLWSKDFIKKLVEEIILNPDLKKDEGKAVVQALAIKMKERIIKDLENFDFHYIGIPKKWGTKYKDPDKDPWQIIGMKLFNTIMNEKILVPMSSSLQLPIKIPSPQDFERKIAAVRNNNPSFICATPVAKLSFIAFPHSYDKEQVRKSLDYYGIVIDPDEVWDKICNSTIKDIVEIYHNSLKI